MGTFVKSPMARIKSFQVRFINGQTINEPVENISILDSTFFEYGIEQIAKISFYYDTSNHFHNLILYNEDYNKLVVEFNTQFDNQGNKIEMTHQEKLNDYNELLNTLKGSEDTIIPYIVNPFIIDIN